MKKTFKLLLLLLPLILASCELKPPSVRKSIIQKNWKFKNIEDTIWYPAIVPGVVHLDLLNNGLIEDPYYRLNELDLQWIDKTDWVYKTEFNISEHDFSNEKMELRFGGLDTYAKIYLNDTLILRTDNMFRRYEIDCKQFVHVGKNELKIEFLSPIKKGIKKYDALGYKLPVSDNDMAELGKVEGNKQVSVFSRKAAYHFGWDWGPRLVTSGIWKPVELNFWNEFRIRDLFIRQEEIKDTAKLTATIEIESLKKLNAEAELFVNGNSILTVDCKLKKGIDTLEIPFVINNPSLWWPNGLGKQTLYDVEVKIVSESFKDRMKKRIGLRTVKLITETDSIGKSFFFEINGKPVFIKGVNYIPQDIFLPRVTEQKYRNILNAVKTANMNMIRVWGGGIYENDIFYDLCDEMGILVWQDFMFSAAMYPGNKEFIQSVKNEAIDNVKRLRTHPSLALWCGNNEILGAWKEWGWEKNVIKYQSKSIADTIWNSYETIFHKILPEVVSKYDSSRQYWSSSPSSGMGELATLNSGDMHYWGVWWGQEPFENYLKNIPRFMSEYGFQSFPEFYSIKKFTLPDDWDIYSPVMNSHQRSSIGNKTIEKYLLWYYPKPKNFESFLYLSQLLQAYGITMGLEAHRRNKGKCMGSLYWQLNDTWPGASWSGIDYYGKWKALHYAVKKAFGTFLISFEDKNNNLQLFVISDSLKPVNAELKIKLIGFRGEEYKEWEKMIYIPAQSSNIVYEFSKDSLLSGKNASEVLIHAELKTKDGNRILANKIYYFVPVKKLKLPPATLEYNVTEQERYFEITISTDFLAKNVYIYYPSAYNFSDNYFDMLPNSKKIITVRKNKGKTIDAFIKELKLNTISDTYEK